jgi:nitrogen fixation/metabolism regulation signal transduction histidine kinase
MVATKKLSWIFPLREFFVFKIETVMLVILSIIVFFLAFLQTDQRWFSATILTVIFIALYLSLSYFIQKFRQVEEKYHLTQTHLEVTRKSRTKTKKTKVALKDIKHHKLDKLFLGGYLVTKKGKKHLLFFNTKDEIEKFENFIKKSLNAVTKKRKKK